MAKNDTKRPIGFNRMDPDPNGTGDGYRYLPSSEEPEEEKPEEKPPRQPKADPIYVGTIEGLEILGAYGLSALAPLSNLEQQLLQVIAGLEKRIEDLS